MKNQYNFLKTIDTSTSGASSRSPETNASNNDKNNRLHMKSSLSKLHNLVTSKFTAPTTPSSQQQQQQQQLPPQRSGRIFSLSAGRSTNNNNKQQQEPQQVAAQASSQQKPREQSKLGAEKMSPELARCYDEIDQIYDYIRGLAPLPLQLRKIKSIDFEQLERKKRLQPAEQQQQAAIASRQMASSNQQLPTVAKTKVRQRDAADAAKETLREPHVQGPLPIKFTTTCESRPSIKRVESLNLSVKQQQQQQPAYLISSPQRGQLFRLPRAHSTSTLTKETGVMQRPQIVKGSKLPSSPEDEAEQRAPAEERLATRTLPVPRLSRVSVLKPQPLVISSSPNRLAKTESAKQTTAAQDLVKSFVDDETASASTSSAPTATSSSNDSTSSSASERLTGQSSSSSTSSSGSSSQTAAATNSDSDSASSDSHSTSRGQSSSAANSKRIKPVLTPSLGAIKLEPQSDKWAEKSHSDYENDTVSLSSGASSLSDLLAQARPTKSSRQPEDKRQGSQSHSSSSATSGRRAKRELALGAPVAEKEHIYEQIPAHKDLIARQQLQQSTVQQTRRHAPLASRPFNYPTAYAASMAKTPLNGVNYLSAPRANTHNSTAQVGGTYPLPLMAMRPLDYRHRLSMNNLHLLPYLSQPLVGLYPSGEHPQAAATSLNRSSSSSKVNRAPRLTPAQLIAQIQMHRTVGKRQQQQQRLAPQQHQQHLHHRQPPTTPNAQQSLFVWPPAGQVVGHAQLHQRSPADIERAQNKRRNGRRLTAIGIESALESVRRAPLLAAPSRNRSPRDDASFRLLQTACVAPKQQAGLGYFEPRQLVKVPLIDDDDDEEDEMSSSRAGSEKVRATTKPHTTTRCLNSVSDLQSFSSSQDTTSSSSSASTTDSHEVSHDNRKRNEGNFVSSSSFIKCYYGREKATQGDSKKSSPATDSKPAAELATSGAKSTKRRSSDKLLGLIGVGTGSQARNKRSSKQEVSERKVSLPLSTTFTNDKQVPKTGVLVGDFLNADGPLLVRDRRIAALRSDLVRHYQHPTVQVASLARAAACPRQRPPQQQVPVNSAPKQTTVGALQRRLASLLDSQPGSTNTTNSTSSYEAAIKNSHERTVTAAPPPPGPEPEVRAAKRSSKPTASKSSSQSSAAPSSTGAQLMRVPKLSKASHLLNRPLPKPPISLAPLASSRRSAAALALVAKNPTTLSRQQAPVTNKPAASISKRKVLATNLDIMQPAATSKTASASAGPSASSLSPLAVSITTHPSPTVTTCTSSGISSRLTAGTHLASAGSSQRSASSKGHRQQQQERVKSFSELHKQFKRQMAAGTGEPLTCRASAESSPDVEERDVASPESHIQSERDDEKENCTMTSNLKLFDERFSFMDQQLASSNDSLLESINFMGTLSRKSGGCAGNSYSQSKSNKPSAV